MQKNYLWAFVIVIVIVLGIIFLSGNKQAAAPASTNEIPATQTKTTPTSSTKSSGTTVAPGPTEGVGVNTSTNQANAPRATVNFTNNGFSPSSIEVKAGTIVTFVNQSSLGMWVASDPHPTHTNYPGFDEKGQVSNGGNYSFTFTKVGTWGYHNHLDPRRIGSIIVQ
jgi:plastocyanin